MIAASLALGVHLGTWHFKEDHGLRDFNPGAYVRADRWQFGAYHNSNRKPSMYVSYAFPLTQRWSVAVGAVTGYQRTINPAAVLVYSFDNGVRLVGIPHTPKNSGGVHAAYEFGK